MPGWKPPKSALEFGPRLQGTDSRFGIHDHSRAPYRHGSAGIWGLILFEEGHMGPISLQEALQRADYLDYTLSHEMGHALLQDLYGIEG